MSHRVYVSRQRRGLGHPEAYLLIRAAVRAALSEEGVSEDCEINVLLTDEAGIRDINRENRNIDAVTDVLSFPFNALCPGEFDAASCERDPETGLVYLGDMALCLPRCEEQGEEFGHGFGRELSYLTVHSVLHLLGYDHMDEAEDKKRMRAAEKRCMLLLEGEKEE